MDEDLVVALRLQEEWDARAAQRAAQRSLSLVDASWELVDPTPDLRALFVQFNDSFFWGQLEAVEVKWSARMTLSAGICCYEGHGGMCSIRLSEPLLKLRPRKDLVETLLHEMIHAYLFVTNNDKDRDGHGPEFCKHMRRINCLTGANITVYHTFHDEVDEYRQHWWRCDGPCQSKQPYYGYVKRAINRAPSAHDSWWAEHQKTCGGTYVKVREPESYSRKGSGKARAGGQHSSAVRNKGELREGQAVPAPFQGKGHILGERKSSPGSSGTLVASRTARKSQDPCLADALKSEHMVEVSCAQQGSSKRPLGAYHQSVLSSYFPRVSVVKQKALSHAIECPSNGRPLGDVSRPQSSSYSPLRVRSPETPLRNPSWASGSAAEPQGRCGSEDRCAGKRRRLGDQATAGGTEAVSSPHPPAWRPSPDCGQSHLVSCPVCKHSVMESEVNEHLDWCLERGGTGGRN